MNNAANNKKRIISNHKTTLSSRNLNLIEKAIASNLILFNTSIYIYIYFFSKLKKLLKDIENIYMEVPRA